MAQQSMPKIFHNPCKNPSVPLSYLFKPIQNVCVCVCWGGGGGGGGGGEKTPQTSFSPVTSTNVRTRPHNFLTFGFNPFDKLV